MHALPCARFSIFPYIFRTRTQQPLHRRSFCPQAPKNFASQFTSQCASSLAPIKASIRQSSYWQRGRQTAPFVCRAGTARPWRHLVSYRHAWQQAQCPAATRHQAWPCKFRQYTMRRFFALGCAWFPHRNFRSRFSAFLNSNTFFCWQCSPHNRPAMHTTTPTTRTLLP